MKRRAFIASLGALVSTSGCTGVLGTGKQPTSSVTAGDGTVEMVFQTVNEREYIEYYEPAADALRRHEAGTGRFVQATFIFTYKGGGEIDVEEIDDVTMRNDGDVYGPITDLPFERDEMRDDVFVHPKREQDRRGDAIGAGYEKPLFFLFDVPWGVEDAFWEYGGTEYLMTPRN